MSDPLAALVAAAAALYPEAQTGGHYRLCNRVVFPGTIEDPPDPCSCGGPEMNAAIAAIPPGAVLVTEEALGQLRAERDFLAIRAAYAGRAPFTSDRFVGVSSNALVRSALGGVPPQEDEYPSDEADLAACRRTVEMAPPHLREVMLADLGRYVAALRERQG